ncbi:MFS transporter [Bacillus sp. ISL-34]|uniref:MFS transporter n=1 Tax=Bacillus sp. ISL-34 TaxID=2819121 RepID=UPI001BEB4F00|nr:MFS transporter [Bacillus sp. ISL-34]MBT2648283.1 MFS transporter [Bacillus sp. ISL-34]
MITGIVFGVLTFWLFAQTMVNVVPAVQSDLGISLGVLNVAISLTALFSGIFVVAAGGLADKVGRKRMTYIGLTLSIIGSLCLILAQGAGMLIIGRVIQGLSAACIMPSTIALIKSYYEGENRQRALSYWSFGSWGGSGICSFAGGAIATYMDWRWIFIFSILFALLAMFLLKDTPESRAEKTSSSKFDIAGLSIFVFVMLALNLVITRGDDFGWTSPITLSLIAIMIIGFIVFFKIVSNKSNGFIELALFKNKYYTGATLSNFLLNAVAGTLVVANTYVQVGRGFNAFQSGLLSLGYLVCVLAMIRVGEKILQRVGARKPMIIGCTLAAIGVGMMALTFIPGTIYTVVVFVGFTLLGIGLGMYATPSIDTAVSNAPVEKIGEASGIYKMASSLGGSFGVAISATVYGTIENLEVAAAAGLTTNVIFAVLAMLSILFIIPKKKMNESKPAITKGIPEKQFILK